MDISLDSTGIMWSCGPRTGYISLMNSWKITKDKKKVDDKERKIREHDILNSIYQSKKPVTNFELKFYKRQPITVASTNLQTWHKAHMEFCTEKASLISGMLSAVKKLVKHDDVSVTMEYYSYGNISSGGSASVQIIECTSAIKQKLILDGICLMDNMSVIPGPIIKKFAGNGNFEKFDMMQAYQELNLKSDPFYDYIKSNFINLYDVKVKGKGSKTEHIVKAPISDLIDAYWIQKYAKDVLEVQSA